jgi:pyrimidine-nucleoside phosphorylase
MDAYLLASSTIDNKTAYEKFKELINYQGGNLNELKVSSNIYNYKSLKSGIIKNIDALKIAQLVFDLGAGRKEINDNVDYGVGVIIKKNVGDYVDKDDILMDIYYTKQSNFDNEDYFVIEDDLNE